MLITLKNDMFGCFRIEEIRGKDNETGLKEGGGIEMSNYSAFHIRDARSLSLSFAFELLTFFANLCLGKVRRSKQYCNIVGRKICHGRK